MQEAGTPTSGNGLPSSALHLPVSIANLLELFPQEAGQERPHPAPFYQGLRDAPNPEVYVARGPVEIQQLLSQHLVLQHGTQLCQCLGLPEVAEASPGVIP